MDSSEKRDKVASQKRKAKPAASGKVDASQSLAVQEIHACVHAIAALEGEVTADDRTRILLHFRNAVDAIEAFYCTQAVEHRKAMADAISIAANAAKTERADVWKEIAQRLAARHLRAGKTWNQISRLTSFREELDAECRLHQNAGAIHRSDGNFQKKLSEPYGSLTNLF